MSQITSTQDEDLNRAIAELRASLGNGNKKSPFQFFRGVAHLFRSRWAKEAFDATLQINDAFIDAFDWFSVKFIESINRITIAIVITSIFGMLAAYLAAYPGGAAQLIAELLVSLNASTGGKFAFGELYAAFSLAMVIMSVFFVYFIHASFGWDGDDITTGIDAEILERLDNLENTLGANHLDDLVMRLDELNARLGRG